MYCVIGKENSFRTLEDLRKYIMSLSLSDQNCYDGLYICKTKDKEHPIRKIEIVSMGYNKRRILFRFLYNYNS